MKPLCPKLGELSHLIDGELTENRAIVVREHVIGCRPCQAEVKTLRGIVAGVGKAIPARPEAIDRLRAALDGVEGRSRSSRWRRSVAAVAAAGAVAASTFLAPAWTARPKSPPAWAARGGVPRPSISRDFGVTVYRGTAQLLPLLPGEIVKPSEAFSVATRAIDASVPAFFMVFAEDAAGVLHWISPAWLDPARDPTAIPIARGEAAPAQAMAFDDLAPGILRVFTVIAAEPLRVSEVEAMAPSGVTRAAIEGRWPDAAVDEIVVSVTAQGGSR
ncbi:MAG: zf-HC2 domain-containing protein [Polyangiaceae bacterium]|jgi:hypothetical protein